METKIPTMLTVKQTAERFGLPVFWIRCAVKQGKVPFITLGSKILINADRFTDFLNGESDGDES